MSIKQNGGVFGRNPTFNKVVADTGDFNSLVTDDLSLPDGAKAKFGGTSGDLQIYHDGANSWIHDVGTGNLNIEGRHIFVRGANTDTILAGFIDGAEARLYHNGTKVFYTTTTGIDVLGLTVTSTTTGVRFPNMTTTQKNAIANTAGMQVFDTTLGKMCFNTGSAWETITSS